ncbi:MAG: flagellar motor switch protein FliM [Vampirovibrionales bacterium]|nr:flagellar motor switch protein FliM [Vampirovibrionales bacterium]
MLSQDEIDGLLSSLSVGLETPAEGASAPSDDNAAAGGGVIHEKRNYKLYNFRRPDKFSKDHLRALQTIHENFARQFGLVLTAYLRMTVEIDVVSVDQLTYDEFIRSMPSPMTVSILELDPLPGQVLMGLGHEVTSSVIDRMLGGPGMAEPKARELTDIEQSLIRRILDRAIVTLEEAWRSVMNINATMVGMEESYALIQVATPGEIVALVTFEVNLGNKNSGLVSFCVPYPVLEGVISQLSAQHIFHRQQSTLPAEEQDKILQKLNYAKMPLSVLLGGTTINVKDLMQLSVGDVIRLDREAKDNLLVCANHKPKFFCRPGKLKDKMAVLVVDEVKIEEAIEGFGIWHGK